MKLTFSLRNLLSKKVFLTHLLCADHWVCLLAVSGWGIWGLSPGFRIFTHWFRIRFNVVGLLELRSCSPVHASIWKCGKNMQNKHL